MAETSGARIPGNPIPYDRLIVLDFEATCDENQTNPAAVQVTKVSLPDKTYAKTTRWAMRQSSFVLLA